MIKKRKKDSFNPAGQEREFEQQLIDLRRVTRIVAGGKRLRFRATIVIGDKKGQIGFGVDKGADVSGAIMKAARQAQKNIIKVPIVKETIPWQVRAKYKACEVLIKPAPVGHGLVAGGVVRVAMQLAGVKNVTAKILGAKNKINNIKATFKALEQLTYNY